MNYVIYFIHCSERTITHYFWKKEYQACDAPQHHVLLWVEDVPIIGCNSDKTVLE